MSTAATPASDNGAKANKDFKLHNGNKMVDVRTGCMHSFQDAKDSSGIRKECSRYQDTYRQGQGNRPNIPVVGQ